MAINHISFLHCKKKFFFYAGKVFQRHEIETIADLCKKHNVLVISDDVYEHMVFDQNEMIRIATLPDMWDRTITIGSASIQITGQRP